ncbi:MAG: hypothetical protein HY741_15840 [Chloroflexi bacterium]|nr:hypothetical protein [Chloroflexota bacterium]
MAIVIRNEHAYVVALSAVWSPADNQLVAFTYQASDKQSLEAIKAQLEKNSKNAMIELRGAEDETVILRVAARGYIKSAVSLERYNATGYAGAMLHWRGGDPRRIDGKDKEDNFFYVVAACGDDLTARFAERLQLAISWAIKDEWAAALMQAGVEAGEENKLVSRLPVAHSPELTPALERVGWSEEEGDKEMDARGLIFKSALRVVKDDEAWSKVISHLLKKKRIAI